MNYSWYLYLIKVSFPFEQLLPRPLTVPYALISYVTMTKFFGNVLPTIYNMYLLPVVSASTHTVIGPDVQLHSALAAYTCYTRAILTVASLYHQMCCPLPRKCAYRGVFTQTFLCIKFRWLTVFLLPLSLFLPLFSLFSTLQTNHTINGAPIPIPTST